MVARMPAHRRRQASGGGQIDVGPHRINQRKGPQPVAGHHHFRVDLGRAATSLQHGQRLAVVGARTAVDDETGTVGAVDHGLSRAFGKRPCERQRIRGTAGMGDEFDENHRRGRIEEMQPHDTLAPHEPLGNGHHRQRRGIGGQHCPRGQMRLDPRENGPLDRQRLGHGLDHNIGRRDVLGPLHDRHARQDGVPRNSRHRALGHPDPERHRKPFQRRCPRLGSASVARTSWPACARPCAMPSPIAPSPMTPILMHLPIVIIACARVVAFAASFTGSIIRDGGFFSRSIFQT